MLHLDVALRYARISSFQLNSITHNAPRTIHVRALHPIPHQWQQEPSQGFTMPHVSQPTTQVLLRNSRASHTRLLSRPTNWPLSHLPTSSLWDIISSLMLRPRSSTSTPHQTSRTALS